MLRKRAQYKDMEYDDYLDWLASGGAARDEAKQGGAAAKKSI
jgi:DUF971 family protein